jgi:hypothetical protein
VKKGSWKKVNSASWGAGVRKRKKWYLINQGVNMKKILMAIIPIVMLLFIVFGLVPSRASAQQPLPWLYGYVSYSIGGGVGPAKPVEIYFEPNPPQRPPVVYTRSGEEDSWYKYSFNPPLYVYKVRCHFYGSGDTLWAGETIINRTLSNDYRADIVVYPQ